MTYVVKRDGREVEFDKSKIEIAIQKANQEVVDYEKVKEEEIEEIAKEIEDLSHKSLHTLNVEEIQDMVEDQLNGRKKFKLARVYSQYRFKHALLRQKNTTDDAILSLIAHKNEEINQENSNKNPTIVSTQRDYMAGEVSKDISRRFLIPEDIWRAHEEGIIHFHDTDYFAQKSLHNCDLVNLKDMLENGTVISGVKIDKPHRFTTACNIATQVIAQVASAQFG